MPAMRIVIIGGGIGGLAAALALRREGFEIAVYERAPALLEVGAAIAVWPNAFRVLERLGLGGDVLGRAGRINRARWLDRDGTLYKQFSFPETSAPAVALHRADLQATLRRALPEGSLQLGKTFEDYGQEGEALRLRFADGTEFACDVLVGA